MGEGRQNALVNQQKVAMGDQEFINSFWGQKGNCDHPGAGSKSQTPTYCRCVRSRLSSRLLCLLWRITPVFYPVQPPFLPFYHHYFGGGSRDSFSPYKVSRDLFQERFSASKPKGEDLGVEEPRCADEGWGPRVWVLQCPELCSWCSPAHQP